MTTRPTRCGELPLHLPLHPCGFADVSLRLGGFALLGEWVQCSPKCGNRQSQLWEYPKIPIHNLDDAMKQKNRLKGGWKGGDARWSRCWRSCGAIRIDAADDGCRSARGGKHGPVQRKASGLCPRGHSVSHRQRCRFCRVRSRSSLYRSDSKLLVASICSIAASTSPMSA